MQLFVYKFIVTGDTVTIVRGGDVNVKGGGGTKGAVGNFGSGEIMLLCAGAPSWLSRTEHNLNFKGANAKIRIV